MSEDPTAPVLPEPAYLGDGVYVSCDGWQLCLTVGAHTNAPLVFLDPEVLGNLINYAAGINRRYGRQHFPVPEDGA